MLLLFACTLCFVAGAYAQGYPSKPVKVIVPYTKGSATDVLARMVGEKLSELWGQPVVVENVPGAGGSTGVAKAAKSPIDGYTLLVHSSSYSVNQATYANLPYSQKDFFDVAPLAKQPYTLVASPSAGVKSVPELIAAAKAKPGQMKFGSAGTGSSTHLVAERFKRAAGIDVTHVPFKGGPEANKATASGEVSYWFPPTAIAFKGVKAGKVVALGVSGATRSGLLPDVPTIAEAAIPGFDFTVWWGVWAPAGIPSAVKDKLVNDVARALTAADLREKLSSKGFEPMSMTPAEFSLLVQREVEASAKTLKEAGIKPK
jgi:tripartite-type tricarboxylate transporter receptor subunit TctC